jgi:hypothetical protein
MGVQQSGAARSPRKTPQAAGGEQRRPPHAESGSGATWQAFEGAQPS